MKIKNTVLLFMSLGMISCATNSSDKKNFVILDEDVFYQQSVAKLPNGTNINFKITDMTSSSINGVLIDNIFDDSNSKILFLRGDIISITKKITGKHCNLGQASLNYKSGSGYPFTLTDFTLLKNSERLNGCDNVIDGKYIYTLNLTSNINSPDLPILIKKDSIAKTSIEQLETMDKVYAVTHSDNNTTYKNISLISDDGVQTIIKTTSVPDKVNIKYQDSQIPINYSINGGNIVINGVYGDILMTYNTESESKKNYVEIIRTKEPDMSNSILINKIQTVNKLINNYVKSINSQYLGSASIKPVDDTSPFEKQIATDNQQTAIANNQNNSTPNNNVVETKIYPLNSPANTNNNNNSKPSNSNVPPLNSNGGGGSGGDDSDTQPQSSPMGMNIMNKLNFNE